MSWFKFALVFSLTAIAFYFMQFPRGSNPPLGETLNPFTGVWQNGSDAALPARLTFPGLSDSVVVRREERGVPHIFAANARDLYFAQGYLEARDRLWQMDFLARAAGGRLAEVLGERLLEYDRYRRRIGMVYAAGNALAVIEKDRESIQALQAYADGVNAWIATLRPRDYPLEFKLMNYRPEPWTPLKSALILKHMAWDLSGYSDEVLMTRTRAHLGDSLMQRLFFQTGGLSVPVTGKGRWDKQPTVPLPVAPDSLVPPPLADFPFNQPSPDNGSNNWALSGSKTASGFPMLCSDPHLGLTLPSIWYEVQLSTPDNRVYGVSLPGLPAVVIGFNDKVAWGLTNAQTDALDWYNVEFENPDSPRYRYNGEWLTADIREEVILVRNAAPVRERIPVTRHGLVVYRREEQPERREVPAGAALRWVAHEGSNELLPFLQMNRARTYADFRTALQQYQSPAQNIAFAAHDGDIAIHHQGRLPLRWPLQGRYVSDGSNPAYDWAGWIPFDQLPQVLNPPEGFVASSNQIPVSEGYPYPMQGNYASFERSLRIATVLGEEKKFTPQDMMALQTDVLNTRAQQILPRLLELLPWEDLSLSEADQIDLLAAWDYRDTRDSQAATFFDYWWRQIEDVTWSDGLNQDGERLRYPPAEVLMQLLKEEPDSRFFDIDSSEVREDAVDVLLLAFQKTREQLYSKFDPLSDTWEWGRVQGTDIGHMARITGLGRLRLYTDGSRLTVNATKRSHGPSWRMVVELSNPPRAWGIYPGGQSGNPGSPLYDNAIDDWRDGRYFDLLFLQKANDPQADGLETLVMTPEPR